MASRVSRFGLIGLPTLVATSVVLLATIIFTFITINDRNRVVADSVREDALWAAYQLDREMSKLTLALHELEQEQTDGTRQEALDRFDILFSRVTLLTEGQFVTKFRDVLHLDGMVQEIRQSITRLVPSFDAIQASGHADADAVTALRVAATELKVKTEELIIRSNTLQADMRVRERSNAQQSYLTLGIAVGALTLSMAAVIAILWKQLRQIRLSQAELRRLSRQYAEAAESAEAGNRAKSAFLAAMSHEIRTPLNGVVGMVELLADSPLTPDQSRKLVTIRECSDALLDIINDVLDFSKLESGTIDLESRPFDLRQLVDGIAKIVGTRVVEKGLDLSVECPAVEITGDQARVRQILLNLVANAVKFTAKGSVSIVSKVAGDVGGAGQLTVHVTDTGIGISEAAQARLFSEFTQVDASISRRFGGTGLGLAICKRIAQALHGEVSVSSVEGRGSTFTLTLPISRFDASRPSVVQDQRSVGPAARIGRVLVVEDNPVNQRVASELLQKMGLQTDSAFNGQEAVTRLAQHEQYDLVLMDMQMPVMDGLEATRAIRAAGHTALPIIGLTANAFVSDREACLAAGMNDFVAKPVNRSKLEAIVAGWLRPSVMPPAMDPLPQPLPTAVSHEPSDSAPESLMDRAQMESLAEELGTDVLDSLFESFWTDASNLLKEVEAGLARGDQAIVVRGLHTVKGIAETVGFVGVARAAAQVRRDYDATGRADISAIDRVLQTSRTLPIHLPVKANAAA